MTLSAKNIIILVNWINQFHLLLLDRIQLFGDPQMRLLEILNGESIQIEDKNICDFKILKNIIFETHLQRI